MAGLEPHLLCLPHHAPFGVQPADSESFGHPANPPAAPNSANIACQTGDAPNPIHSSHAVLYYIKRYQINLSGVEHVVSETVGIPLETV